MKSIVLAACGLVAFATAAHANLIQNGSFELSSVNPNQSGLGYVELPNGDTSITGWSVGGSNIDYIGSYWQASNGSRSIDLSGNAAGSVYQTFTTTPGATYSVSFDMAGNPDDSDKIKKMLVSIDGSTFTPGFNTDGRTEAAMGWTPESFTFVANASSSTLTFAGLNPTPYGAALDNVSVVSAVPLPASLPMFGAALLALSGLAWLKRRGGGGASTEGMAAC